MNNVKQNKAKILLEAARRYLCALTELQESGNAFRNVFKEAKLTAVSGEDRDGDPDDLEKEARNIERVANALGVEE